MDALSLWQLSLSSEPGIPLLRHAATRGMLVMSVSDPDDWDVSGVEWSWIGAPLQRRTREGMLQRYGEVRDELLMMLQASQWLRATDDRPWLDRCRSAELHASLARLYPALHCQQAGAWRV